MNSPLPAVSASGYPAVHLIPSPFVVAVRTEQKWGAVDDHRKSLDSPLDLAEPFVFKRTNGISNERAIVIEHTSE